jgi:anti-anti-sigma factor
MITKSDNNVLTIFLDDRIDAQNAAQTERDLLSAVREGPDKDLVLDAEKLTYISSAGLRILLKLRKEINSI